MYGAICPLPQYVFMAWCSVKTQGQLYIYLTIHGSIQGYAEANLCVIHWSLDAHLLPNAFATMDTVSCLPIDKNKFHNGILH